MRLSPVLYIFVSGWRCEEGEVYDLSDIFSDAVYHSNTSTQKYSEQHWERNAYNHSRANPAHRFAGAFLGQQCRNCELRLRYGWWYFQEEMGKTGGEVV